MRFYLYVGDKIVHYLVSEIRFHLVSETKLISVLLKTRFAVIASLFLLLLFGVCCLIAGHLKLHLQETSVCSNPDVSQDKFYEETYENGACCSQICVVTEIVVHMRCWDVHRTARQIRSLSWFFNFLFCYVLLSFFQGSTCQVVRSRPRQPFHCHLWLRQWKRWCTLQSEMRWNIPPIVLRW